MWSRKRLGLTGAGTVACAAAAVICLSAAAPANPVSTARVAMGIHLAGSAAATSQIGDFLAWTNVQRAHHLTKFAARYVAVGSFVCRIFFAESL